MDISNALASVPVADLDDVAEWYELLLGPGRRPMDELIEWQFSGGGGLQVYAGTDRSGGGSCTLIVDDIDAVVTHLRTSGLAPDAEAQRNDEVDTVMIKDPAGNSLAFAAPHSNTLTQ